MTTKRGRRGLNVSYSGYVGVEDAINRPEHMDVKSYLRLENVAHANTGRPIPFTEEEIQQYAANAPSQEYPLPYPYYRRDDLGMLQPAPHYGNSLTVTGGNDLVKARASLRRQDVGGIAPRMWASTCGPSTEGWISRSTISARRPETSC